MTDQPLDPLVGTTLGDYHIDGVLGMGAMGRVYSATRMRLGQRVALKVLEPYLAADQAFRARFEREWRLAASMNHPNIVPIFDAGEIDGRLYLAMLPVDGSDLGELLQAEGPLGAERAVSILAQVANALDAAHARGLVHRDVKPGNILIARGQAAEGEDHVYLADFGLTKHAGSQSRLTRVGTFVGTYHYAAPEQFGAGEVGPPADIYALGCVLYECLTGRVPFETDSDAALMRAHLSDPLPSVRARRPDLPAGLDEAIGRATAKDPAARHGSARQFVAEARAALRPAAIDTTEVAAVGLSPTVIRPTSPPAGAAATVQPVDRRPLYAVASAVGLLLLVGAGALWAGGGGSDPSPTPTTVADPSTPQATATMSPTTAPTTAPTAAPTPLPTARPTRAPTPTPTVRPTQNPWPLKDGVEATDVEIVLMRHVPPEILFDGSEPRCARYDLYSFAAAQIECIPGNQAILSVTYVLYDNSEDLDQAFEAFLNVHQIEPDNGRCDDQNSAESGYNIDGVTAGRLACTPLNPGLISFAWIHRELLIYSTLAAVADTTRQAREIAFDFWLGAGPDE